MSYWINQPFDNSNTNKGIQIIKSDLSCSQMDEEYSSKVLPEGFKFKTLGTNYLEEICALLTNHYTENDEHKTRLTYSRDFIYWYLKYIPEEFIVGLTYKNKLIGMITAMFIDMIIYEKKIKIPYINFLCVQTKLRNLGFGLFLINEIKKRLSKINIIYSLFTETKPITKPFCITKDFVIPVNYQKLKNVGFLLEDLTPIPKLDTNPLHLMLKADIKSVVPKLNNYMEKFLFKPYFTNESAQHFLLPKKNIVYSFVNRNINNEVTDFISVYKFYYYCLEKDEIVHVAQIAFYYNETMDLTQLVTYLLDKLFLYHIDQLIFKTSANNMDINITRFSTYSQLYYYFFNVATPAIDPNKICFYPF